MTAVLERTQPLCELCNDARPATWAYYGNRAAARNICDFHRALFQANVDPRPAQYRRLDDS